MTATTHHHTTDAGFTLAEEHAMAAALRAAATGVRGANPLVGAALLDVDGRLIAVGHHRGAGTDHAEVDVLHRAAAAGASPEQIAAATMVVTLEPCNHTGRTGACTEAILAVGIRSVVHAIGDPHRAAAGGAHRLRAAGVDVRDGLLADQAFDLNRRWLDVVGTRPFVTLKIAQSLDGAVAAADGTSQWITGPAARQDGHRLRELADAVLVSTGTVLADDPTLTARHPDGTPAGRQPRRVVMGLRPVPAEAAVRGDDGRFRALPTHDPDEALAALYADGTRHVLIDGSPRLSAAFARAGLVDELIVYQAPLLIGGRPAFPDLGLDTLDDALRFEPDEAGGGAATRFGPDTRLRFRPVDGTAVQLDPETLDPLDRPQTSDHSATGKKG
ncbi:bifunctional diaminohydroxyphosphoribosylaminopyrimidine deaminase/5-amino-6-(5-phosphoribosylamino)uracil reductase RibD [Tersicoccus sp. Bi-70]|uniref:bifunctional diaminohydroxyphosphoribosylaminopyrimidine deaminase/5-amino-6-(5-phosphoribosylamino)uracil reductase RibD n=1 Tax=Tersicoccus sp. Bi-70 TaxID=1897634 RepID=UPI0009785DC8|nr:bifunctional diaminohydroxyphosphoribosylaminopyrimidine deaminase/5-amino-6-(5-phosphoribosylamino)uracil reductase RibD [Tersicoccus sp. Bi-70]OMH33128.1 riboflavin biosynthesis protein RibD [Tersicoccus sp. Bi-70]